MAHRSLDRLLLTSVLVAALAACASDTDEPSLDEVKAIAAKYRDVNVAKAEGGGIAYRLGWVLYWTAIALTGLYVAYWLVVLRDASWAAIFSDLSDWSTVLAVILPAFALYGVGRAFRYVLSGE